MICVHRDEKYSSLLVAKVSFWSSIVVFRALLHLAHKPLSFPEMQKQGNKSTANVNHIDRGTSQQWDKEMLRLCRRLRLVIQTRTSMVFLNTHQWVFLKTLACFNIGVRGLVRKLGTFYNKIKSSYKEKVVYIHLKKQLKCYFSTQ